MRSIETEGAGFAPLCCLAHERDGIREESRDGFIAGAQFLEGARLLRGEGRVCDAGELQKIDDAGCAQLLDAREREAVEADFEVAQSWPVGEPVVGCGAAFEITDFGALFGPGLREGFDEEAQQGEDLADEAGFFLPCLMRSVFHGRHYMAGQEACGIETAASYSFAS